MDELNVHQSIVTYVKTFKEYRDGLAVAKFLSGLHPDVTAHIRGNVLVKYKPNGSVHRCKHNWLLVGLLKPFEWTMLRLFPQ